MFATDLNRTCFREWLSEFSLFLCLAVAPCLPTPSWAIGELNPRLQEALSKNIELPIEILDSPAIRDALEGFHRKLNQIAQTSPLNQSTLEELVEFLLTGVSGGPDSDQERTLFESRYRLAYSIFRWHLETQPQSIALKRVHSMFKKKYIDISLRYIGSFTRQPQFQEVLRLFDQEVNRSSQGDNLATYDEALPMNDFRLKILDLTDSRRSTLDTRLGQNEKTYFNTRDTRGRYVIRAAYERQSRTIYLDFYRPVNENLIWLAHELTHAVEPISNAAIAKLYNLAPDVNRVLREIALRNFGERDGESRQFSFNSVEEFLAPYFPKGIPEPGRADFQGQESVFIQTVKLISERYKKEIQDHLTVEPREWEILSSFFASWVESTVGNEYRAYKYSLLLYQELVDQLGQHNVPISPRDLAVIQKICSPHENFIEALFHDYGKVLETQKNVAKNRNPLISFLGYVYFRTLEQASKLYSEDFQRWASQIRFRPDSPKQGDLKIYLDNTFNVLSRKLSKLWVDRYREVTLQADRLLESWNQDALNFAANVIDTKFAYSELQRLYRPPLDPRFRELGVRNEIAQLLQDFQTRSARLQQMQAKGYSAPRIHYKDFHRSSMEFVIRDVLERLSYLTPKLKESLIGVHVFLNQVTRLPETVDAHVPDTLASLQRSRQSLEAFHRRIVSAGVLSEQIQKAEIKRELDALVSYLHKYFDSNSKFTLPDANRIRREVIASLEEFKRNLHRAHKEATASSTASGFSGLSYYSFSQKGIRINDRFISAMTFKGNTLFLDASDSRVRFNTFSANNAKQYRIGLELADTRGRSGLDTVEIVFE